MKCNKNRFFSSLVLISLMISLLLSVNVSAETNYAQIPKLYGYHENAAAEILNSSGVKYTVVYEKNDCTPGTVFKFVFCGFSDKDSLYVNTQTQAKLYVSGSPPEPPPAPVVKNAVQPDSSNVIYLTFDDGPGGESTLYILDILEKYDVKATFFLIGTSAESYPGIVRRIYEDGHTIACHTYDHRFTYVYSSVEAFEWEIKRWEYSIRQILGKNLEWKIFRFPGGSNNSYISKTLYPVFLEKVTELGYLPFDWTFSNNDAWTVQKKSYQTMDDFLKWSIQTTLASREKTPSVPKIVLMHDTNEYTAAMVEWTIRYLIEKGYAFGTIDTLSGGWLF